jgi:hypothetical protein
MVMLVPAGIRPRLRVERRFDRVRMAAERVHHIGDHVVGADADAVAEQLDRQMPVAEVPGDSHQLRRAVGVDFKERFRLRDHADDPAVLQLEAIAVAQANGVREVDQDLAAGLRLHYKPPPVTAIEVDQDAI